MYCGPVLTSLAMTVAMAMFMIYSSTPDDRDQTRSNRYKGVGAMAAVTAILGLMCYMDTMLLAQWGVFFLIYGFPIFAITILVLDPPKF